jgi:fructose-bisphosphate aldolase class 1
MTDDLVKRLRERQEFEFIDGHKRVEWEDEEALEAADCIEELKRAVLDLAQYVSSADLGFYIEPETRKVLNEIGEKKDD